MSNLRLTICDPRLVVVALSLLRGLRGDAAEADNTLNQWLQAQTNIQTWSAEFVQTRALKSLANPLTEQGRVWFAVPNQFRWELGTPPKTIAVRQPEQLLVIYPRLKRAEKYALDASQSGPWRDTLALLEAGFPRSRSDLEERYRVRSQTVTNGVLLLALEPRSSSARRMMPLIAIGVAVNDASLRSTELRFADGSTMRNDFTNAVINPKLEEKIFEPEIGDDFKVAEPLLRPK